MRRGIGLANPARVGIDDQHRLRCHVEQHAVPRLGLTQADVVAFQRLLGLQQSLLHYRCSAHVATDRDHPFIAAAPIAQCHDHVAHRHVTARRGMIDLPPARRLVGLDRRDHLRDFWPALDGHGIDPRAADPIDKAVIGQLALCYRDVEHVAVRRQDDGDVADRGQQGSGDACGQRSRHHVGCCESRLPGRNDMLVHRPAPCSNSQLT